MITEIREDHEIRLLYRLSLAWGMPVSKVIESMTLDDLRGWVAYSSVEPWGPLQDEIRFATVAATMANSMGAKVSRGDLFPSLRGIRRQVSDAEIKAGFAKYDKNRKRKRSKDNQ